MLVTLVIGLFLGTALYNSVTKMVAERDLSLWTSTQGTLSNLAVENDIGSHKFYIAVEYGYVVGDERFSGKDYEHRRRFFPTEEKAQDEVSQGLGFNSITWWRSMDGSVQAKITERMTHPMVYFNSSYPQYSVLRQFSSSGNMTGEDEIDNASLILAAIFAVLTLLCIGGFLLSLREALPPKA